MPKIEPTQADREAAAMIAAFYLGNGPTMPSELRSGAIGRHFTLDVIAAHRLAHSAPAGGEYARGTEDAAKVADAYSAERLTALDAMSEDDQASRSGHLTYREACTAQVIARDIRALKGTTP